MNLANASAVALLAAIVAVTAAGNGTATVADTAIPRATVISVSLGRPTELSFKLSRSSLVPLGRITFEVTNAGVANHAFEVCSKAVTSRAAAPRACTGLETAVLKPRQSTTLTVTISRSGKYEFLDPVNGHAAAGMKGVVGVGVPLSAADEQPLASAPVLTTGIPSRNEIGPAVGCPPGVTVEASGKDDGDADELGTERDDHDGCL